MNCFKRWRWWLSCIPLWTISVFMGIWVRLGEKFTMKRAIIILSVFFLAGLLHDIDHARELYLKQGGTK